jgi:hypothetical protein
MPISIEKYAILGSLMKALINDDMKPPKLKYSAFISNSLF